MNIDYAVLRHQALSPGLACVIPNDLPAKVSLDAPAVELMTDFNKRWPETTTSSVTLDEALEKMKRVGVRLLLVVDENDRIVGVVNAGDILGEKPIRIVREESIPRHQLTIGHVMLSCAEIEVLDMALVDNSRVGHIVSTLNALNRHHMLVVEQAPNAVTRIRGLFSATEIGKRTGIDVNEVEGSVESLAEMRQVLTG